jgi:electron transport complex protein RnfG
MSEVELTVFERQQQQPSSARLVATLGFAGMIAGLVLSGVHQITEPIIARNNQRELEAAVFKVVPGAERMRKLALRDGQLRPAGEIQGDIAAADVIYAAYAPDGSLLGYAIEGEGAGYQDTIRLLYGYDPARNMVIGMEVLESRETPGLGDRIYKDESFTSQFDDLSVEPEIVLTKEGATTDHEVDAITGATISSAAVVSIINRSNARWLETLPPPDAAPPAPEETKARSPNDQEASGTTSEGHGERTGKEGE